ncbi:MAG: hypothetical protein AAGC46_00945 [Solirubrobacteraceae bacterium]|nr:hypothetical protein [Patulibacter sp.]
MSHRLRYEAQRVQARVEQGEPYWPAFVCLAVAVALNLALADRVTVGPWWLVPAVGAVALVALAIVAPTRATHHVRRVRTLAICITAAVTLTNVVQLVLLAHYLIDGGDAGGHSLIVSGVALWLTNVLLFGVWYWEMDRGGPVARFQHPDNHADFMFPQMDNPHYAPPNWRPGFGDYLYTSLTAATAFSPTDTMPLTQTAKLVMAVQSTTAFATIGLVIARAVNILG